MVSMNSYFEMNGRNAKSGRLLKCGIIVSLCVGTYNICEIFRLQ